MRKKKTGTTFTHALLSASCLEIRKLSDRLSVGHAVALPGYVFLSLFFVLLELNPKPILNWQTWRFLCLGSDASPDCNASRFRCSCTLWISSSVVPPKPAHLLALGQDKKPKRIPPAPSRPLPAPPPPPKPKPSPTSPGSAAQPQKEAQKVGLLIERFENSRYFTADFWSVRFLPFYYSVSLNTAQSCLGMSQR